ncbi:MAG: hypothetical protein WC763_05540 [Candidatus Paceibacterota bacterium]
MIAFFAIIGCGCAVGVPVVCLKCGETPVHRMSRRLRGAACLIDGDEEGFIYSSDGDNDDGSNIIPSTTATASFRTHVDAINGIKYAIAVSDDGDRATDDDDVPFFVDT